MEVATQNIQAEQTPEKRAVDERFMRRALDLAARGIGLVSPSPLVGCVIVSEAGDVVGEGFYVYDNVKHAETLALERAGSAARGGTAYVSLEPHAHHGRTPPCTESLIRAGITRVVYAIDDPNPLVSGRGGQALRNADVEVRSGVLAQEAARLNEVYLHFQKHHRPFVHLKMACSLDGKIATRAGEQQWLTGDAARVRVHELRHQSDAILVGVNTVITDNPMLTDRSGLPRRRPLTRVVLDHRFRTPMRSKLVLSADGAPVVFFTAASTAAPTPGISGVEVLGTGDERIEPQKVLGVLGDRGIRSVLVEGGPSVAAAFLAADLVDKVTFLIAPVIIGGGDAPSVIAGNNSLVNSMRLQDLEVRRLDDDVEISGYIHSPAV